MKIRFFYLILFMLLTSLCFADTKVANSIGLVPAWLDNSISSYSIYRDSSLTQEFRDVMPAVCQYIQPSTVIGQYYSLNYTDILSEQNMNNGKCEIKYHDYGYGPIAMCASKFKDDWESPDWQYVGEITEFDILINSYHTWVTGQFGTSNVYDREHSMRHEVAHAVGSGHTPASQIMDITYNQSNPVRNISDIDYDIFRLIGNPAGEIIEPQDSQSGYYDFLRKQGGQVVIKAIKPEAIETNASGLGYYSLNEDLSYHNYIETDNEYGILETNKYVLNWSIDTTKYSNKAYNIRVMSSGYAILNAGKPFVDKFPHDELKIRFSNLTLKSPEYNKEYSIYAPLDFEVFGKSESADVSIMDIYNIGTVEYVLEKEELFGNELIFSETTNLTDSLKFKKDLSTIQDLETGDYLVSVTVRDLQNAIIAEIEEMPIRINTRSIQIVRQTTEEFLVYDFENAFNLYLSGQFYHEEELSNNAFTIPAYDDVELYDVDWCEEYGSNEGVYAGVYPSSLLITDYSYLWNSDTWPGSKKHEYSKTIDYSEIFSSSIKPDHPHHPVKDSTGKTWFFDFDGDNRLQLRPGLYRFLGNIYQKSTYPQTLVKMAETDTLTIFIPSWKMKTEPDLRFGKDREHFRKGDDIEVCIWRPVNGLKANNTQVSLYSDNKAQLLSSETVSYADSLGVTTMVNFPTTNLDYGFYTLEAKEIDYTTGREVIYQNEIQVCPFYVRWENGGLWPSDWPGMNDLYWRLSLFANTDPMIKSYAMKNNYDYDTDLYPLMNTQMNSPSVTLTKPYDAFMQIYIGLWRINNIFKELLAEYTVSISVNNKASWDVLKTATAAEWATYPWPTELNRWCFTNTETTIKYTNQPIYIKLSGIDTKGIPRDTIFTEGTMYDEIMIAYTKETLLESPNNLAAQFYEAAKYTAVQLTWDQSADFQTGRYYRVYRDGLVIADQLTTLSYLDYSTVPDRMYNYIVTLVDPSLLYVCDAAYESPKAGHSINFFTGLLSPSNLVISEENPNVRLTWSPVSGASGYKVYSSGDPYGTFTENTTGTFNGEEWVAPLTESKLFYYVVAVNENKKVIKILRTSGNQVK